VVTPPAAARSAFAQFANIIECLQKNYVDPSRIGDREHATAALREFVRSLDPDADLLTAQEAATNDPDAGDIGVDLALRADYPTVISVRDASPGQIARLFTGDQILSIDGQSTAHARMFAVTARLRGAAGSKVTLRVLDPASGKTREVVIERAADSSPSPASLKFLTPGVAYFRLSAFTVPVVEKFLVETKRAQAQRARGLILDVRNNAGGAFDAALVAARLFVPATADIVLLDYSEPKFRTSFVSDSSDKFTAPVVLLVNGGTAAEAEIFAAALRDHKRARLVGSQTSGRGRFVDRFPLSDGSVLLVPSAVYLPPSRRAFADEGLSPDVPVSVPRETERSLSTAGFGSFDWVHDKAEVLKSDLALARALELLAK
jgi:carboxyl-terminal processing protease